MATPAPIDPTKEYSDEDRAAMRAVLAAEDRRVQEAAAARAQAYKDALSPTATSAEFAKVLAGLQDVKAKNEADMNVSMHVDAAVQAMLRIREAVA